MGGQFVTPKNKQIEYDPESAKIDTRNKAGMICTVNPEVYERSMGLLNEIGLGD